MKLDLTSWMVRLNVKNGTSTPSWGTALGQGKGYLYTFSNQAEYISAMDAHSVDEGDVNCPLGKGGNKIDDFRRVRTAVFNKIIVHYDDGQNKEVNSKFIIIEVEELKTHHAGRKSIKYSPNCIYKKDTDQEFKNQTCFDEIDKALKIDTEKEGWFVSQIEFTNNDLHLYVNIVKRQIVFNSITERKQVMLDVLNNNLISHYTSLDSAIMILAGAAGGDCFKFRATRSDCMNDPQECIYGQELYSRIIGKEMQKLTPFILSFCKTLDDPVMWRLYQSQVQFVFAKDKIQTRLNSDNSEEVNLFCGDVIYAEIKDIEDSIDFFNELKIKPREDEYTETTCRLKPKDYSVENEWRVCALETDKTDLSKDMKDHMTGAGFRYGLVKLFRNINIPKDALREVIIFEFDDNKFNAVKAQLEDLFRRVGIYNIPINQTGCAKIRS